MMPISDCLADLVPGVHAALCRALHLGIPVWPGQGKLVPLTQLIRHRTDMLAAMEMIYDSDDIPDERALMSQWSKYYLDIVLPAALAVAQQPGYSLALPIERCTLFLQHGLPKALWLPADTLRVTIDTPEQRYRSLCVDHLLPLFDTLSASVRLPTKVLWNNAGNSLEHLLKTTFDGPRAHADLAYLFEQSDFFGTSSTNPLYRVIRYVDHPRDGLASPFRSRKVCCLRDRFTDDVGLCSSCPLWLSLPEAQVALQLKQMME